VAYDSGIIASRQTMQGNLQNMKRKVKL